MRRALTIWIGALALAAVSPSLASATLNPAVTVNESAGNAAASHGSVAVNIAFNQSTGDAVKNLSLDLPPGLLIDEETDGGACLAASTPAPACQIGAGSAVLGGATTPMSLYLVRAPTASDLAGVQLVAGVVSLVGALSFRSTSELGIQPSLFGGDEIDFAGLPPSPLASMSFTLTGLTLPTSCQPTEIAVWASSEQRQYPWHALAPFTVSGCSTLEYLPTAVETIARDSRSTRGTFALDFITPPGDSASQSVKADVPANLSFNPSMAACLNGSKCTVGTVTATSPIIPAVQLRGTMTLSGIDRAPSLSISFPPPLNLQLSSSWSSNAITIYTMPDLPLTNLQLSFTGNSVGRMFVIQCYANTFMAEFTPKTGTSMVRIDEPIREQGCQAARHGKPSAGRPQVSGMLRGVAAGAPRVSLKVSRGEHAPSVRSLSIWLPHGLSFSAAVALARPYLALSGAKVAHAAIRRGALVLRFRRPSTHASLTIERLIVESAAVRRAASSGHLRSARVTVAVTDASGRRSRIAFAVKL